MKLYPNPTISFVALAAGLALLSSASLGAASVAASSFVGQGNWDFQHLLDADNTTEVYQTVYSAAARDHDLSEFGGSGYLEYTGQGSAMATYSSVHASAKGSVNNSFYDLDYVFASEEGVPTTFVIQSNAEFTQNLMMGGTATNYTSTYLLNVTGSIEGTGRGSVVIELTHGSAMRQEWIFNDVTGDFNLPLQSQTWVHGNSPQTFKLSISTLYSFDMDSYGNGSFAGGEVDFSNSVEVVGIDLRDEQGVLQAPGSITSDSGHVFDIITIIPEPGSSLLLVMGVGALGFFRRRV